MLMNQVNDRLNIDTPENVTFGYEIAGIGSRFLAALIDTALITFLQVIIAIMAYLILNQSGSSLASVDAVSSLSGWAVALIGLIALFFYWGYYIFFEMLWNGKSPGKSAVKLRVIRVDGTPITISESLVRNLVRVVDFLPAYYGVGAIAVFVNPQTRRLGDLAAGTVVIRETDQRTQIKNLRTLEKQLGEPLISQAQINLARMAAESPADAPTTLYPIKSLNYQDIQMIEMFFQRRNELTNRSELAGQIILRLWEKMKLSDAAPVCTAAESALAQILKDYRQSVSR
jgi:uncharacterized RDD family membrane protein YckC